MLQTRRRFSIHVIKDEVQALVAKGKLDRQAQLFRLSRYFVDDEWKDIEHLLTLNEYLLRDSVSDLLDKESWMND
ncbi:MAG: DUF4327 family protein [Cyanobacteria bacterium J06634_6]